MEDDVQNDLNRKYSVPNNSKISYDFYEGYLEKKARNMFLGFQKRYFRCLEGKIIIYTEKKESKQINGQLEIKLISSIKSTDIRTFIIQCDNIEYVLKAQTEELKNKWIEVINTLIQKNKQNDNNDGNLSFDATHTKKIKSKSSLPIINKNTAKLIKKYGYIFNKEENLSKKLLDIKGISKLIKVNENKIEKRIHYGIMNIKEGPNGQFNKRWVFIFSPRPLYNKYYNDNTPDLEQKMQKDWIKFDTLYIFKCDKIEYNNNIIGQYNTIELAKSHYIINFEKNEKYFINLDIGDKIYNCYCEIKSERDEWFEVIKNSQKTSKEYQLSITKHPRNVEILNTLYEKDEKEFMKKIEEEKVHIIGNCKRINEFNIFEFTLQNFQNLVESTIDGFLCSKPNNTKIVKLYAEHMIIEYLEIIKLYWNKQYNNLTNDEILKISCMILNFGENMHKLHLDEPNLIKNGRELCKIYYNKKFQNFLDIIENILKNEREKKGAKNEEGIYYTQGPKDLYDILNDSFESIKLYKHPIIYKKLLKIYYISITQYIIGVNCLITNQDLIIEHNYLISVANSSFNLIQILNNLIDNMKKMEVLSEKEIIEEVEMKKITYSINKLTLNSLIRFVYENKDELSKEFENINFIDLKLVKVVVKTSQIFNEYKLMMSVPIVKRCWNEILKLTLCYYISSLLLTGKKKKTNINEIKAKIKDDQKLLIETYNPVVGENLTKTTIEILNNIYDFFEVSLPLVVSSCLIIRQYIGPAFSGSAAKKLVSLRRDLTKKEREQSKKHCEEALKTYKGTKSDNCSGYFNLLGEKITKIDKEKKILKKISEENSGNNIIEQNDTNENLDIDKNKDKGSNIEDEKKQKWTVVKSNLGDFLKDFSDGDEDEGDNNNNINNNKNEIKNKINEENEKINDIKEICDVDYEGFLNKKAFQFYKKFYFQIKNGFLYMFKDKISNIILNKYSLKSIDKVENYKQKKFILKILEHFDNNDNNNGNNNKKKYFREHKFKCANEKEKNLWMSAFIKAIKKVNSDINIQTFEKIEIKEYKIVINDFFNLKNIKIDEPYMQRKVLSSIINEDYFHIIPSKVKNVRKSIKKIKDEEKKNEKNKKSNNEEKSVGNKIKNWFKIGINTNNNNKDKK